MCGTLAATSFRCAMLKGFSASIAIARVCRTVLVEPPHGHIEREGVLERLLGKDIARAKVHLDQLQDLGETRPCYNSSRLGSVARTVPLPGRAMPSASHRQFMLFAVNIPEQEPQVGTGVLLDLGKLVQAHLARGDLADAFKDADQIDGFAG